MGTRFRGKATEVRALDAFIKLMRASESVWQARAKAWRGARARATDSSRPPARSASMRSRWRMRTLAQDQVMISPSSLVPGRATNRPLARVSVVMEKSFG